MGLGKFWLPVSTQSTLWAPIAMCYHPTISPPVPGVPTPKCQHVHWPVWLSVTILLPPASPWLAIYWTIPAQWSLAGWTSSWLFWTYFPTWYYVINFVCSLVLVDLLWWCCQYEKDRLSRGVQCFSTVLNGERIVWSGTYCIVQPNLTLRWH